MPGPVYDDWTHVHVRGDRAKAAPHLPFARKMLGYLQEQRAGNGVPTQVIRRSMPDGTEITARFNGDMPRIEITTKGGEPPRQEEVIYLYVSATDGVRIYDMGTKKLVKLVTGLGDYLLHDVNTAGNVAWLTYAVGTNIAVAVRLDIAAVTAASRNYPVKTEAEDPADPPIDGLATESDDAELSPDNASLLMHFAGSATTEGALREGVGGILLLDAETLAPKRPPIRMTFEPAPMVWAPDGTRFYIGATLADDPGDISSTTRLVQLIESTADYLAAFDADGVLVGTRQLSTWLSPPNASFARTIKGIVASNTRIYVSVDGNAGSTGLAPTLHVLDATDVALPVVATLDLSSIEAYAPPNLLLTRDGKLILSYADRVAEIDLGDDDPSIAYTATHAEYVTWAPGRSAAHHEIQNGPASRYGGAPDNRRFFYNIDVGVNVVRGYRTLEPGEDGPVKVYELALVAPDVSFKSTFCLASVGLRAPRKAP